AARDRGRWVRVIDRKTAEGGMVSIRVDVTDLKRREAILSVVNAAASQILMSGGWRAPVEDMLSRLGPAMGVSRVSLRPTEIAPDGRYLQADLFEWDAPGIRRVIDDPALAGIALKDDAFQEVRARRARGEVTHALVRDLPEDQRQWLAMEGVKSYMRVPIMV